MTSSFCCCIPGCCNRHIEWTTPLPRDELLHARWSDAIRAGTGGLSPLEARVCNAHFTDKGIPPMEGAGEFPLPVGAALDYQEPTLFYRNNVPLQVFWCRLCLCHDTLDSLFNVNERSSIAERTLSWMANKHFGFWLDPAHAPEEDQYFCKKCKVQLEATHSFWMEIQQAAEKYRLLQEKMSTLKLPLIPSDPVMPYPTEIYSVVDKRPLADLPPKPVVEDLPVNSPPAKKPSRGKMFAVVEFVSKTSALKVLAVPMTWLKDDLLMWPKLMNGAAIYALRKAGESLDGDIETDSFPVIVLQHFEDYLSAEAAVQVILRRRNPEPISTTLPKDILTHMAFRNEIHHLKADLNSLVQTAVEAAAERSFRSNFNHLSMAFEHQSQAFHGLNPAFSKPVSEIILPVQAEVEKHRKISIEPELDDFNTRLADPTVCQKYLDYFAKFIHPANCSSNGDNALYTIVDYLFTRDFWNNFTWTGINRGQKSSRGFREFANVTHLLLNIVLLGDSTYDSQRLERFCRTKLFRYSKTRATNKQLRKSTCRPGRKRPAADDSRSSEGGGEMELTINVPSEADQKSMICKMEAFPEELWRQSSEANPSQYSDEMM